MDMPDDDGIHCCLAGAQVARGHLTPAITLGIDGQRLRTQDVKELRLCEHSGQVVQDLQTQRRVDLGHPGRLDVVSVPAVLPLPAGVVSSSTVLPAREQPRPPPPPPPRPRPLAGVATGRNDDALSRGGIASNLGRFCLTFPVGWFSAPSVWGESANAGSSHTTQSATECMRGVCVLLGYHCQGV